MLFIAAIASIKYKEDKSCGTPHITEDGIKQAFVRALNRLLSEKDELVANVQTVIAALCDTEDEIRRQEKLHEELELFAELTERCVGENARIAIDQDEYGERYNSLVQRYEKTKAEFDALSQEIIDKNGRKRQMEQFARIIADQEPIAAFEARLWTSLVDFMTICGETEIYVTFKDGTEIRA